MTYAQDGYVFSTIAGQAGAYGSSDGVGVDARFNRPIGITVATDGGLFIVDSDNCTIRRLTQPNAVTTFAGKAGERSTFGNTVEGAYSVARFGYKGDVFGPDALAIDGKDVLYVFDTIDVRKLSNGAVETVLLVQSANTGDWYDWPEHTLGAKQDGSYYAGYCRVRINAGTVAEIKTRIFRSPATWSETSGAITAMAVAASGDLVVMDAGSLTLNYLKADGSKTLIAGANGIAGSADGNGTAARFGGKPFTALGEPPTGPKALAVDNAGNIYVCDTESHTIRRVTPLGQVTTIGGKAGEQGSADGVASKSRFSGPKGMAVDQSGNLYISDTGNHTIRKGAPAYLPKFTAQPQGGSVKLGGKVALSATVASNTLTTTYQWQKDGVAITGATAATLEIVRTEASDAGSYAVVATNDLGSVTSSVANLTVEVPAPSRLVNVSIRTGITTAAPMVTVGFVVGGGSKPLLVRTVGPTLKPFGVGDAIADPKLALFRGDTQVAANDNWSTAANPADVAAAAKQVGAFALGSGAADAALLTTLNGAAYTVQATGVGGATGTALVEVYDVDSSSGGRLVNVSSRAQVGTGDNVLVAGFAVTGTAKKTLLIRAVGPTLASFGVAGTLSDPKIELIPAGATAAIASNDNWAGDPALVAAFTSVGAFSFTNAQSKDAALIVTVSPGSYSAKVSGFNGATGEALVEIYEMP